jgi:serine/threonine protein kinase
MQISTQTPNPIPIQTKRKSIGVGSYGCVYRPSLKCESKIVDYTGKISKLLHKKNSIREIDEYMKIANIDKNKDYFLGTPEKCKVDVNDALATVDKDCTIFSPNNIDQFELLISKDGGMDLDGFLNKELDTYIKNNTSPTIVDDFLLNIHNLLVGIKLFIDNDIVHYDIKPSNIVFDKNTDKFNFIDFGLMSNINKTISDINAGRQKTNIHWSYPIEYGFLNKTAVVNYKYTQSKTKTKKFISFIQNTFSKINDLYFKDYFSQISATAEKKELDKIVEKSKSFSHTFVYMNDMLNPLTNQDKALMATTAITSMNSYNGRYDELLEKCIKTMDTYALGFTINNIFNKMFLLHHISREKYIELHMFCRQLFDFNIETRLGDPEQILLKYEEVLEKIGVMNTLDMHFVNHKLTKGSNTTTIINPSETIPINSVLDKSSDISLEKSDLIVCPKGKEYNTITQKCADKCKAGKERNENGRCVIVKQPIVEIKNSQISQKSKKCPPGKEINIYSGRCAKPCSPDKIRTPRGRCISRKTKRGFNPFLLLDANKNKTQKNSVEKGKQIFDRIKKLQNNLTSPTI